MFINLLTGGNGGGGSTTAGVNSLNGQKGDLKLKTASPFLSVLFLISIPDLFIKCLGFRKNYIRRSLPWQESWAGAHTASRS